MQIKPLAHSKIGNALGLNQASQVSRFVHLYPHLYSSGDVIQSFVFV